MGVTADQLVEGGSVFLRIDMPRPGAQSEMRLKPARVLDVERGAASIRLLESGAELKAKFSRLEPDVDFLARHAKEEQSRYQRKRSASRAALPLEQPAAPLPEPSAQPERTVPGSVAAKSGPLRVALAERLQARQAPAPALPAPAPPPGADQWDPNELAPAQPPAPAPEPVAATAAERAAAERAAWLEMGEPLLRGLPADQRAELEQRLRQATGALPQQPSLQAAPAQQSLTTNEAEARQEETMPPRKQNKNLAKRYDDATKRAALAELAGPNPRGGLAGVAKRFGVAPNTLDYWRRTFLADDVPAAKAKPGPKPKAAAPALELVRNDVTPLGALEKENRRLLATVAVLLERAGPAKHREVLEADNLRLQRLIEQLLGLEA